MPIYEEKHHETLDDWMLCFWSIGQMKNNKMMGMQNQEWGVFTECNWIIIYIYISIYSIDKFNILGGIITTPLGWHIEIMVRSRGIIFKWVYFRLLIRTIFIQKHSLVTWMIWGYIWVFFFNDGCLGLRLLCGFPSFCWYGFIWTWWDLPLTMV